MKRMVMQNDEEGIIPELMDDSTSILGYKLEYLNVNQSQIIHKVEVRNINIQDIVRHLRRGESVLITPKLQENSNVKTRNKAHSSWYFTHT
jgi:hypothetical protein